MKVAVIGSNGQLGSDIVNIFSKTNEVVQLTHDDIEISDIDKSHSVIESIKPNLVINTAAYHNVPQCEENSTLAFKVNAVGAKNLALLSSEIGFKLIHFSTDYVFDGTKQFPYVEDDSPNPLNAYANSKLAGEYFIKNYSNQYFIIRVSGIYGKAICRAKGSNFISTMIKLSKEKPEVKVVNDEILTPTSTLDIALNTVALANSDVFGTYHMTCEGECSWYEFAKEIFSTLNLKTPLYETSVKQMNIPIKRPFYSVLENRNLKEHGINNMPHWKESLNNFLKREFLK